MKTPDDSKCGMECIRTNAERICVKPEKGQCPRCEQIVEESLARIRQLESEKWDLFFEITAAYYGKMMYGLNDDGTVYSRYSCEEMMFGQAVDEFKELISGENT